MKLSSQIFAILGLLATGCLIAGCGDSAAMNESTVNVKHITQQEFPSAVTDATNAVVVDFYATWCGPCKMLGPIMDKQADAFVGKIKFYKVNVDESQTLAQKYDIQAIPTVLFFKDGKLADRNIGLLSEDELKFKLNKLVAVK